MRGKVLVRVVGGSGLAGSEHEYSGPEVKLGTAMSCHVCFDPEEDSAVRQVHAVLSLTADGVYISGASSDAPTLVNDEPIDTVRLLGPKDIVMLGDDGPTLTVTVRELPDSVDLGQAVVGQKRRSERPGPASPAPPRVPAPKSPEIPITETGVRGSRPDRDPASEKSPEERAPGGILPTVQGTRRKTLDAGSAGKLPPVRLLGLGSSPSDQGSRGSAEESPDAWPGFEKGDTNKKSRRNKPRQKRRSRSTEKDSQGPQTLLSSVRSRGDGQGVGVNTLVGVIQSVTRRERRRTRVTLAVVAVVVLLGAIGAVISMDVIPGDSTPDFVTVFEDVQESVCLVIAGGGQGAARERAFGTAWSVGPGVFATNSHVAEGLIEKRDAGASGFLLRVPGEDQRDLQIADVVVHPSYMLFRELLQRYSPFDYNEDEFLTGVLPPAFDVALITIEDDDRSMQPPPLPLRTSADGGPIRVGEPIGSVGYPMEGIGINIQRPAPETRVGSVVKFTDSWLGSVDAVDAELITYQWESAGGASGSPVFDARGRVVGLLSGGNVVGRSDSGARLSVGGTSFGPDVRLLRELIDESADAAQEKRRAAWEEELQAAFERGTTEPLRFVERAVMPNVLPSFYDPRSDSLVLVHEDTQTLRVSGGSGELRFDGVPFSTADDYVGIVLCRNRPTAIWAHTSSSRSPSTPAELRYFHVFPIPVSRPGRTNIYVWSADGEEDGETEVSIVVLRIDR